MLKSYMNKSQKTVNMSIKINGEREWYSVEPGKSLDLPELLGKSNNNLQEVSIRAAEDVEPTELEKLVESPEEEIIEVEPAPLPEFKEKKVKVSNKKEKKEE